MDEHLVRKIVHKIQVSGLCLLLLLVVLSSAAGANKCLFLVLKTRLLGLDSTQAAQTLLFSQIINVQAYN